MGRPLCVCMVCAAAAPYLRAIYAFLLGCTLLRLQFGLRALCFSTWTAQRGNCGVRVCALTARRCLRLCLRRTSHALTAPKEVERERQTVGHHAAATGTAVGTVLFVRPL
jgi:hypothetical protein